jgi:hypothetical protein
MGGTLGMVVGHREVLVPEICVILTGCVVIAAFDFAVAAADGGVDGLMCLPVEIKGEAVGCFAGGTGESGCLAGVLLKIWGFVHCFGCLLSVIECDW